MSEISLTICTLTGQCNSLLRYSFEIRLRGCYNARMMTLEQDAAFMGKALAYAAYAAALDEVPVGAVLVCPDGRLLAGAGNNCIQANDPTGHAEMHVLRIAAEKVGNYRLPGTTLYVTLEPCPMCATALLLARVERIVFGATDPKGGGIQSVYCIGSDGCLNHRFSVTSGVRAEECGSILRAFFRQRRGKSIASPLLACQTTELGLNRCAAVPP